MALIEVRCCCQPHKVLGWLPVYGEHALERLGTIRYLQQPGSHVEWLQSQRTVLELPVALIGQRCYGVWLMWPALKGEETPIEELRKVRSFVENTLR